MCKEILAQISNIKLHEHLSNGKCSETHKCTSRQTDKEEDEKEWTVAFTC
jgi:hypothetical protein